MGNIVYTEPIQGNTIRVILQDGLRTGFDKDIANLILDLRKIGQKYEWLFKSIEVIPK